MSQGFRSKGNMANTVLIEVASKPNVVDPVGQGLEQTIKHLHLAKVKRVSASQLYRIEGELSAEARRRIGAELLSDPVIQEFQESEVHDRPRPAKGGPITIDVWYKAGVTDVVGESVAKGIRDLDIKGVNAVRAGMRYRVWGLTTKSAAEKLALALLVNPLVQDQLIHVD